MRSNLFNNRYEMREDDTWNKIYASPFSDPLLFWWEGERGKNAYNGVHFLFVCLFFFFQKHRTNTTINLSSRHFRIENVKRMLYVNLLFPTTHDIDKKKKIENSFSPFFWYEALFNLLRTMVYLRCTDGLSSLIAVFVARSLSSSTFVVVPVALLLRFCPFVGG